MSDFFSFDLEAEFMLASSSTLEPLWFKDLNFSTLDQVFDSISLKDIPSLEGLDPEPTHKRVMPFVVEGYALTDDKFEICEMLPKGVEIRTPVCKSLDQVLSVYEELFSRVKNALSLHGLLPVAISHHPIETKFYGPQNHARLDRWAWVMEVMTTFGPDINVSFPKNISDRLSLDLGDLNVKVNYYAPAMVSLSLFSFLWWRHMPAIPAMPAER